MPNATKSKRSDLTEGLERLKAGHHLGAWIRGFKPFMPTSRPAALDKAHSYVFGLLGTILLSGIFFLFPLLTFGELFGLLVAQHFSLVAFAQALTKQQVVNALVSVLLSGAGVGLIRLIWLTLFKSNKTEEPP